MEMFKPYGITQCYLIRGHSDLLVTPLVTLQYKTLQYILPTSLISWLQHLQSATTTCQLSCIGSMVSLLVWLINRWFRWLIQCITRSESVWIIPAYSLPCVMFVELIIDCSRPDVIRFSMIVISRYWLQCFNKSFVITHLTTFNALQLMLQSSSQMCIIKVTSTCTVCLRKRL